MNFKSFLFSWQFLLSIIFATGIVSGMGFLAIKGLDFYTNHGIEVEVPSLKNRNITQATEILEENNLKYEIDSFKYDPKFKPFQIISIYPLEGSKVKEGRVIFIKCNPKTWKPISLPNLIDKSKHLAFSQLELLGLKVGDTLYETNISKDRVIRMLYKHKEIKPGDRVPKFSTIDLVIGLGLINDAIVPDLIGLTYPEAEKILKENYFEEGILKYLQNNKDPNAIIYYQEPLAGSKLDQGLSINLWLSNKSLEELTSEINQLNNIHNPKSNIDSLVRARQVSGLNTNQNNTEKPKDNTNSTNNPIKHPQENDVVE